MKIFVGPRLRKLRREVGATQAVLAKSLGISTSYVNLLENNERSVSAAVLLRLLETYGVDWRDIADDANTSRLADLRATFNDPLFESVRPDLSQLRAAMTHCPDLVESFTLLYTSYRSTTEHLLSGQGERPTSEIASASPEALVHAFFRSRRNYFEDLEMVAEKFFGDKEPSRDEIYSWVKRNLRERLGLDVSVAPVVQLKNSLRFYDSTKGKILLSEALDYPNRVFQLLHVSCLVEHKDQLDAIVDQSGISDERGRARCRIELANYYAAAITMPYKPFLKEALASKYDFDHLATRFGASFEQACHRAATLQRPGEAGVPLFFFRIDRAGNVSKRLNATDFQLAEYGGACPRLNVHNCFRTPDRITPQLVEMPDSSQFIIFARTVNRPIATRHNQDNKLAIAVGCDVEHAKSIGYADELGLGAGRATEIGINCRVCPRGHCEQRAQAGLALSPQFNTNRRGATRHDG
ncbi:MAG: helix-turn-helix domain-containing protein [Rhizobiaceae bacterium]